MKTFLTIAVLSLAAIAALTITSPESQADYSLTCAEKVAHECYAIEKDKPHSSRGGLSAEEYCAAIAVAECSY